MFGKFVYVSDGRRRVERLAEQLAEVCMPRIRSQMALRQPAIAGTAAAGDLQAWAASVIREVTASEPLPGLTEAQWQELVELAIQRVVEAGDIQVRRKAA